MKHTLIHNHQSQFIEMFGNPLFSDKADAVSIREAVEIVLGSTPNSKEERYWNGNLCWITPAELSDDSFEVGETVRHISEEGAKSANLTLMPKGTVLLSTRAPIGKVALITTPMFCNQGFKNMICTSGLNNVFLYYTLKYNREKLQSMGTGTTFKELSKKVVESIKISIPDIKLQMKFEEIYRQADKSKFGGFKSQFIEMFGKQKTPLVRGCELFTLSSGKSMVKSTLSNEYPYNCYGGNGITGKARDYIVESPTIVIGRVGEYCGCVHKTTKNCWITDNAIYVKSYSNKLLLDFILYAFIIADFHRFATESGQPKITQEPLLSLEYPVPSIKQQESFISLSRQADKSKYYVHNKLNHICHILMNQIPSRRCS